MENKSADSRQFIISPNWGSVIPIDYLIANGKFIFSNTLHKGSRPRIVLDEPFEGVDCIEIGYDRHGLITESEMIFSSIIGNEIADSSKDIQGFISAFLMKEGVSEFIKH